MIVKFSRDQELNIERAYYALKGDEIHIKKEIMLNRYHQLIDKHVLAMGIRGLLDEIVLDVIPRTGECFSISDDRKKAKVYFDELEDERELNQMVIHQLGHIQDVLKRGFDLKSFEELKKVDPNFAFFVWDIFLNGRLCREKYFSYFQVQSLYYEFKMKLRSQAKKEKDSVDKLFDAMWSGEDYKVPDIRLMFYNFM